MTRRQNIAVRTYYGVPKFAFELLRATKIPTIILLAGLLGLPLLSGIFLGTYASMYHSVYPAQLFIVGVMEFKLDGDPSVASQMLGIPVKLNAHSGGNPNGVPG